MKNLFNIEKGAVALISILIISAITILLVMGMSEVNISNSYQYLNNSNNKTTYYAAEACLEEALIRLEKDTNFSSTVLTFDNDLSCSVTVAGDQITIVSSNGSYTETFQAQILLTQTGQSNNIQLLNWKEI